MSRGSLYSLGFDTSGTSESHPEAVRSSSRDWTASSYLDRGMRQKSRVRARARAGARVQIGLGLPIWGAALCKAANPPAYQHKLDPQDHLTWPPNRRSTTAATSIRTALTVATSPPSRSWTR